VLLYQIKTRSGWFLPPVASTQQLASAAAATTSLHGWQNFHRSACFGSKAANPLQSTNYEILPGSCPDTCFHPTVLAFPTFQRLKTSSLVSGNCPDACLPSTALASFALQSLAALPFRQLEPPSPPPQLRNPMLNILGKTQSLRGVGSHNVLGAIMASTKE